MFLSNCNPGWQIQLIRPVTVDQFTASVFDKLLNFELDELKAALDPVGDEGSTRECPLELEVDLPALQQHVKELKASKLSI